MRALYTSASGMAAQQLKLDTIGSNMANLGTAGYKAQDVQFKDMLYAQITQKPEVSDLTGRVSSPGLHLGHGVKSTGVMNTFTQGSFKETGLKLDLAIEGDGFFVVEYDYDAQTDEALLALSRDGSFKVSIDEFGDSILVNSNGFAVRDMANGGPINVNDINMDTLSIGNDGRITAQNIEGEAVEVGQIGLVQVGDPNANLQRAGENLFRFAEGADQGQIVEDLTLIPENQRPRIKQGFLEESNVDMTRQMTDMIVAQRAYSMNVRSLQTVDQMMGLANNLRG